MFLIKPRANIPFAHGIPDDQLYQSATRIRVSSSGSAIEPVEPNRLDIHSAWASILSSFNSVLSRILRGEKKTIPDSHENPRRILYALSFSCNQ
jgi:hypothetical protein